MRTVRQLPRTYVPFVLVSVPAPLLVMLAHGDTIRPSVPGLAVVALLLVFLARGSFLAWALLLLWNVFFSLAIAASIGGQMLWDAPVLALIGLGSAALLLSLSMRAHVGIRRSGVPRPAA